MSQQNDAEAGTSEMTQSDPGGPAVSEAKKQAGEAERVPVTQISEFFAQPDVNASQFFKDIKAANVVRFEGDDISRSIELMEHMDADAQRLWSLISQASRPDAVERWIWPAVQNRLKIELGENFDPQANDKEQLLKALCGRFGPRLRSGNAEDGKKALNLLRAGVTWLIETRSLDPWGAVQRLVPIIFKSEALALRAAARAVQLGRANEFKSAVAMAGLGKATLENAVKDRDNERASSNALRLSLADSNARIERLEIELENAKNQLSSSAKALTDIKAQLEAERQHSGHDISQTIAEYQTLLSQRMGPLIADAIDALEIEPPAQSTALKRIKAVQSLIEETSK